MKLRLGDRLLILLEALLTLALVACAVLNMFGWNVMGMFTDGVLANMGTLWGTVVLAGIALIVVLLGIFVMMVAFRREPKKYLPSFVLVESGEKGQIKISISAIRQMVEQAVCRFDGVTQMRIEVKTTEDTVTVDVDAVIASGVHVPTVTLNMQRAIREYVEENCGIAVRSVDVTVNSVDVLPETARPVITESAPKAIEEEKIPVEAACEAPEEAPAPAEEVTTEPAPETEVACEEPAETVEAAAEPAEEAEEN